MTFIQIYAINLIHLLIFINPLQLNFLFLEYIFISVAKNCFFHTHPQDYLSHKNLWPRRLIYHNHKIFNLKNLKYF